MYSKYVCGLIFLGFSIGLVSCKKEVKVPEEPEVPVVTVKRTDAQLLKDSIYYYYKLYSLWEESIPKYEPISNFTDTISSASGVLTALKKKTPVFASYTGGTYDRFSFFSELDGAKGLSSNLKMDTNDGFGIYFSLGAIDSKTAYPFIYMVEGGSPASTGGLRRSDMVLSLNTTEDMKIEVDCSSGTCRAVDQTQYNAVISALNSSLSASSMKIKVQKANDTKVSYDIVSKNYEINPLLLDTVFEFSNKNVGYIAYSSFEQIENNNQNQVNLDKAFSSFGTKNVKDLIVDLRYNGGGYVDAAVYFANKIINSAGNNKLMLKYEVNTYLKKFQTGSNNQFSDVYFAKNNNLELESVTFIVSENTASASEMLINVLKPYLNVKLVAEGSATYGKPVGFFEQKIMNEIGLWVTSFKLFNANNESNYWTGIVADKKDVSDYIFIDFGEKDEKMIEAALSYTGAVASSGLRASKSVSSGSKKMKIGEVTEVQHKGALKKN